MFLVCVIKELIWINEKEFKIFKWGEELVYLDSRYRENDYVERCVC